METKSHYRALYVGGVVTVALLIMVIAIAAQSQNKVLRGKTSTVALTDSLLPDSTKAKVELVNSIATMAEKVIERDSLALVREAKEIEAMRKNSAALEDLVNKKDTEPLSPKTVQVATNVIKYPDTLTIIIKPEKKGLFKRSKE